LADEAGNLRQVDTPKQTIPVTPGDPASAHAAFVQVRDEVKAFIGSHTGPDSMRQKAEAVISADHNLHHKHVVAAITHVSGYRTDDGQIVRLIDSIRFESPRNSSKSTWPPLVHQGVMVFRQPERWYALELNKVKAPSLSGLTPAARRAALAAIEPWEWFIAFGGDVRPTAPLVGVAGAIAFVDQKGGVVCVRPTP
jgi:hypothetical protein